MVMDTVQVRLAHGIVNKIDELVETGIYSSRSDVLRDAVRRLVLDKLVGVLQDEGDSVKEIRELRKKLSKEKIDLDEINKLAD
ncbi:MAG: ribbon-helix-helix domain-containing protein [Nanoarchaeota archaeon]|nr:ribbon-helix-helix domain-containing protein [Nanoarchaeota archaeon]MBU1103272.1 ribbon-helix-helix domain-containing protein [Nanoarchaeota archaeon]